jgi:hypothetical protein
VLGGQSVERAQQVGGGVSQEMSSSAWAADRRRCCIRSSGSLAAPRGRGAGSALGGFGDFGGIGKAISACRGDALWGTLFCVQIHHFDGKHEHNLERGDVVTILRRVARRRQAAMHATALTSKASANRTKTSSVLRAEGSAEEGEGGVVHCDDCIDV